MEYAFPNTCQIPNLSGIYNRIFGEKIGCFVEVGAYDGIKFSNTSGLAEKGWRGLYIEPVKEYLERCRVNHRGQNMQYFNLAVSDYIGHGSMYVNNAMSYLETCPDAMGTKYNVNVDILDRVLMNAGIPAGFEILNIDVEGLEPNVLRGFSLDYWKPKLAIIETAVPGKGSRADFINLYFQNYELIFSDETNNVYVKN